MHWSDRPATILRHMSTRPAQRIPANSAMTTPSTPSPSPATADAPIAVYREKHYCSKRQLDLFLDRVRVRGSLWLRYDYDMVVPLDMVHPQATRFWIRDTNFVTGLAL